MDGNKQEPFLLTPLDSATPVAYIDKVFFFPRSDGEHSTVVQNLRAALAHTLKTLPLLAGWVITITRGHQRGWSAITGPWTTADEILGVKDLTATDFPDYGTLRSRHFPMVHVDYGVLLSLPRPGAPRPVFIAQANFIKGGLILATAIDHAFTDGAGSVSVLKIWAAYCRGDDGAGTIMADTLDRGRLMEGAKAATLDEFPPYIYVDDPKNSAKTSRISQRVSQVFRSFRAGMTYLFRFPVSLGWRIFPKLSCRTQASRQAIDRNQDVNPLVQSIFFFPRAKLNELKDLAAKTVTDPKSESIEWISTNDALASLLWCCIITAMKKRLHCSSKQFLNQATAAEVEQWSERVPMISKPPPSEPTSALGFALNARRLMDPPIAPDYIGNVVLWFGIAAPVSSINSTIESVGKAARFLRGRIKQYDTGNVKRMIGAIGTLRDLKKVEFTRGPFPDLTLAVNSWADQGLYDLDWGNLVGRTCERIRIAPPSFPEFCLVLPRLDPNKGFLGGDGLEVVIIIKKDDMDLLQQDPLFNRFAVWRCH